MVALPRPFRCLLFPAGGPSGAASVKEAVVADLIAGGVAVALLAYLVVALLRAEDF